MWQVWHKCHTTVTQMSHIYCHTTVTLLSHYCHTFFVSNHQNSTASDQNSNASGVNSTCNSRVFGYFMNDISWLIPEECRAWEHGFAGGSKFGKTPCHVAWELCSCFWKMIELFFEVTFQTKQIILCIIVNASRSKMQEIQWHTPKPRSQKSRYGRTRFEPKSLKLSTGYEQSRSKSLEVLYLLHPFPQKWVVLGSPKSFQYRHPLSSRRLDATRHSVIWAKAFYGIWLVGHACAVLCWGAAPLASSLLLLRILVLKIFQGIHDGFLDSQWILGFTIQFHK